MCLTSEGVRACWQAITHERQEDRGIAASSSVVDRAPASAAIQHISASKEQPSRSGEDACSVQLVADEAAGSVRLSLHCEGSAAEGTLRRQMEQEEAVRKAGGPDRPSGVEERQAARSGQAACDDERQGRLCRARAEVRAGVVALTERAACCEGAPDNEPEVRRVRATAAASMCAVCAGIRFVSPSRFNRVA
jgi:hypothetical protein